MLVLGQNPQCFLGGILADDDIHQILVAPPAGQRFVVIAEGECGRTLDQVVPVLECIPRTTLCLKSNKIHGVCPNGERAVILMLYLHSVHTSIKIQKEITQ